MEDLKWPFIHIPSTHDRYDAGLLVQSLRLSEEFMETIEKGIDNDFTCYVMCS